MVKVLALDGGGIKGAFTAGVLASFERASGKRCHECFDLIVGTSTGGILALGLAAMNEADALAEFYCSRADRIFPRRARTFVGSLRWWFAPKYPANGLQKALEDSFLDAPFHNLKVPVAIPTFECISGLPVVYRNPALDVGSRYGDMSMVQIAMATSAAPTFFAAHERQGELLLDGGVWANNPVLLAVIEAVRGFHVPTHDVQVLSVGTTTEPFLLDETLTAGGRIHWADEAATLFMRASKRGAHYLATAIAGCITRVDCTVAPNQFDLDSAGLVRELRALGETTGEQHYHEDPIVRSFFG